METIGLVGIGATGEQFTTSLEAAGYDTVASDTDPERIDVAVERGAARADSPTAVVETSDAVVLAVPGSAPSGTAVGSNSPCSCATRSGRPSTPRAPRSPARRASIRPS